MKPINAKLLSQFLNLATKELKGDWILMGGTLLPALGIDYRQTVDIDFVPMGETTNTFTLQLMQIAENLGLAVESINPGAEYFLKKIPKFSDRLIILKPGKLSTIYRPSLDLYLELKLSRASPSDITDCEQLIDYCKREELTLELKSARTFLERTSHHRLLVRLKA